MNQVAVVVRLCYLPGSNEDEWRWRRDYFFDAVLPRIRAQTVPTDVWVWVDPRHVHEVEARGVPTFTVDMDGPSVEFEETTLRGYPWSSVRGLPKYLVQVLIGSDDLMGPLFVAVALEQLALIRRRPAIVAFRTILLDVPTGKLYQMHAWHWPGPMLALGQKVDDPNYTWVWVEAHNRLQRLVKDIKFVQPGHAVMSVHTWNDSTRVNLAMPPATVDWL